MSRTWNRLSFQHDQTHNKTTDTTAVTATNRIYGAKARRIFSGEIWFAHYCFKRNCCIIKVSHWQYRIHIHVLKLIWYCRRYLSIEANTRLLWQLVSALGIDLFHGVCELFRNNAGLPSQVHAPFSSNAIVSFPMRLLLIYGKWRRIYKEIRSLMYHIYSTESHINRIISSYCGVGWGVFSSTVNARNFPSRTFFFSCLSRAVLLHFFCSWGPFREQFFHRNLNLMGN